MNKIGVLLSAGGSAFLAAIESGKQDPHRFFAIVDRECEAQIRCRKAGVKCDQVKYDAQAEFSSMVAERFAFEGCEVALLYFSRLVSPDLFNSILTLNVHPSLTPSYIGLNAVAQAHTANSRFQGATLHLIDEGVDSGPIISQTILSVPVSVSLQYRMTLSYVQKILVTLSLFDLSINGRIDPQKRGLKALNIGDLGTGRFCNPDYIDPKLLVVAEEVCTKNGIKYPPINGFGENQ